MRLIGMASAIVVLASVPALADVKKGFDAWERGDYPSAIREWRPLAIAGDAEAQYNMGQAYKLGRGVPVDLKLAEDWFRKSALQGNQAGKDNYGLILFQNGKRAEALPYIEDAAGRGDPRAQYVFGTALFNGDMVTKDWPRAYALMTRASAAGIPAASASLAQMDKFIPLDQRTRGLALARAFEAASSRPLGGGGGNVMAGGSILPETLPPSDPARTLPPEPRPVRVAGAPKPISPKPVPPKPVPVPVAVKPVAPPPPGGKWRVQLAAFSDGAKAGALWNGLHARIAALGPYQSYVVKAGPITRLQAGPLASRAAAEKLCAAVKAAGQACLAVAP